MLSFIPVLRGKRQARLLKRNMFIVVRNIRFNVQYTTLLETRGEKVSQLEKT